MEAAGTERRRVVLVVFPRVQSLDVTGPVEVFAIANRFLAARADGGRSRPYDVRLVAPEPGLIPTSSGLGLHVGHRLGAVRGPVDTLLVAGGDGTDDVVGDDATIAAVRRIASRSERVTSVCTGAFVLAAAGLLDGRRATTHWASCERLAADHPEVTVDAEPIHVRDGHVATSAGITAGIDLCLALVEDDHGRALALRVARQLVVFLKRPGGQTQFSAHLRVEAADRDVIADAQRFAVTHLADDLRVERLAAEAAMSPRHFARTFRAEVGVPPGRFVEQARVEAARRMLEDGGRSIADIARTCGFGTSETLRRSFLRSLRVAPSEYRLRFQGVPSTRHADIPVRPRSRRSA